MINFQWPLSSEDTDVVKLAIVKLLFDKDMVLDSGVFLNELDGTKHIKIVLKPKELKE